MTPSPVIAVTAPRARQASTMSSFCCGSVRANTRAAVRSAMRPAARSGPLSTSSSPPSSPTSPTRAATARAVAGWSPVMRTGVIPAARQAASVVAAADFGGSLMATRPSSRRPVSTVATLLGSFRHSVDATARTRKPREARIAACCLAPISTSLRSARTVASSTTSGAPFKHTSRSPEAIRCTVVMRLRRLSNGASHVLGYSRLISA